MTHPTISVCIPTYNNADTVEKCVESILSQTGPAFELLIVDDQSSDATVDLVRTFADRDPRVRISVNEQNLGLVGNHNRCLELAEGGLIKFVHADDWLLDGCLERMAAPFADERIGLVYAPRKIETSDHEAWADRYRVLPDPFAERSDVALDGREVVREYIARGGTGNWFGEPTAVMFRASAVEAVGGMNRKMVQMVDMDLWLRIAASGRLMRLPDDLSVRVHSGGTASMANWADDASWLDRSWLLYGLSQVDTLAWSTRVRAAAMSAGAVARAAVSAARHRKLRARLAPLRELVGMGRRRRLRAAIQIASNA